MDELGKGCHIHADYIQVIIRKHVLCSFTSAVSNSLQSMDCSPPGSSVHEILQARILELGAMPHSNRSSQPKDPTSVPCVSCIAGRFVTAEPPGKALYSDIRIRSISGAMLLIQLKFTISTIKRSLRVRHPGM